MTANCSPTLARRAKATVTVLIACAARRQPHRGERHAGLGGTVRFRDDDVSYIRAIVPTDRAEAVATC